MSLRRDYQHYFCGSWIAWQSNGLLLPILVTDIRDRSDLSSEDFSEEHREQLYFMGILYQKNEATGDLIETRIEKNILDPELITESPPVGYVQVGTSVNWTHINPVRQRMKGLSGNKLRQVSINDRQGRLMYDLFNPSFDGLLDRFTFINPLSNKIYYKGAEIGRVDSIANQIVLMTKFSHVQKRISPSYPDHLFVFVERV